MRVTFSWSKCAHCCYDLMSTSGNFSVVVRARPDDANLKSCVKITGNTVAVVEERHGRESDKSFNFDCVLAGPAKQEQVFAEVSDTVDAVPNGFHGCIFAYGPTGSGKTHTMMGNAEAPGIVPRAVNRIFDSLARNVRPFCFCFSSFPVPNHAPTATAGDWDVKRAPHYRRPLQ